MDADSNIDRYPPINGAAVETIVDFSIVNG